MSVIIREYNLNAWNIFIKVSASKINSRPIVPRLEKESSNVFTLLIKLHLSGEMYTLAPEFNKSRIKRL